MGLALRRSGEGMCVCWWWGCKTEVLVELTGVISQGGSRTLSRILKRAYKNALTPAAAPG